jgi:hypothetical protein
MQSIPAKEVPSMTNAQEKAAITRRTALAGMGAGSLGLAFARTSLHVSAQDSTPTSMTGHPFVGTWIVDRNPADPTEVPTYNIITPDGALIDPTVGAAGVWEATGPDTASFTLSGTITEPAAYFVVRTTVEVDPGGDTATASGSSTLVAADGTILDQAMFSGDQAAHYVRIKVEPPEAMGQPLPGFPAWTPIPGGTPVP